MKTGEIFSNKKFVMSAEVFPPKTSGSIEVVVRALKDIQKLNPDFVSITYGAGGNGAETAADVATIAHDAFDMQTVAHMTAVNMTEQKLEKEIEILRRKNIFNILVLRGDICDSSQFFNFRHANELALAIKKIAPEFNLIGACYPEKHPESKNIDEDIDNLKRKVDSGIEHLITQMFFDNEKFYTFLNKLKQQNINLPVEAGIMPIVNETQVSRIVALSNASIPQNLQTLFDENKNSPYFFEQGINFAIKQIEDLHQNGVDGIHLYTMNKGKVATRIFNHFEGARK